MKATIENGTSCEQHRQYCQQIMAAGWLFRPLIWRLWHIWWRSTQLRSIFNTMSSCLVFWRCQNFDVPLCISSQNVKWKTAIQSNNINWRVKPATKLLWKLKDSINLTKGFDKDNTNQPAVFPTKTMNIKQYNEYKQIIWILLHGTIENELKCQCCYSEWKSDGKKQKFNIDIVFCTQTLTKYLQQYN